MGDQLNLPGIPKTYLDGPPIALCPPVIKYAGGKRWLAGLVVPRIHAVLSNMSATYIEPFCGGLAVGLAIGWPRSIYGDIDSGVANVYMAIAVDPDQVADALDDLATRGVGEATYYEIRREVWPDRRGEFSQFAWAARMIYLNKQGFNGLLRVNRCGQFNVPWGGREALALPSRDHLRRAGQLLAPAKIWCGDFGPILDEVAARRRAGESFVVYLDPPYGEAVPGMTTRGVKPRTGGVFTGYTSGGFSWADQVRLADQARALAAAGCCVIASNAWTDAIRGLYVGFVHFQIGVRHAIGATGDRRGRRAELVAIDEAHAGVFNACGDALRMVRG